METSKKDFYVGEVKAIYKRKSKIVSPYIKSNLEAEIYIRSFFPKDTIEHREILGAIFLNNGNMAIGHTFLSEGGITGTVVDIRLLFQKALLCNAVGFILFHNHPSGSTKPSSADVLIAKKLKKAGEIMDIRMLDSLIITTQKCVSVIND